MRFVTTIIGCSSTIGSASGDRFSPKVTVGLTLAAIATPYVSYAEGYRAPSITETFGRGSVRRNRRGAGRSSPVPDGQCGFSASLPNAGLRPEVGKNKEIGLNVKKNDIFYGRVTASAASLISSATMSQITSIRFSSMVLHSTRSRRSQASSRRLHSQYVTSRAPAFRASKWRRCMTPKSSSLLSATIQEGKNTQTNIGLYSVQPQSSQRPQDCAS